MPIDLRVRQHVQCMLRGFYGWCQAGYSSVGRASDCRACRDQTVPDSIPGAGFAWRHTWIKSWQMFCSVVSTSMSLLWHSSPRPPSYWAGALPTKLKRQWRLPASILPPAEDPFRVLLGRVLGLKGWNSRSRSRLFGHRALATGCLV